MIGLATLSCASDLAPTSPIAAAATTVTARQQIVEAVGGRRERGVEDDILRMESALPGIGGAFVEDDMLVIYVPGGTARQMALSALGKIVGSLNIQPAERARLTSGQGVIFRTSRYAFSQLVAWQENASGAFFSLGGVTVTDADERLNQLSITVLAEKYRIQVLELAASLGIPSNAVNVMVRPMEQAMAGTPLSNSYSQTGSGIRIANPNNSFCSLGWNVHRGPDGPDGEEGFFTAGHCASIAQPGTGIVGPMFQPDNGRRIGLITQHPLWNVQHTACSTAPPPAGPFNYCGQVDAMYVRYDDPAISLKRVPWTAEFPGMNNQAGETTVDGWWTDLSGTNYSLWVGDPVDKVGQFTGWTRGTLSATCAHTGVGSPGHQNYMILCADKVANARAGTGDSGGPVFQPQNPPNAVIPLGILFSSTGTTIQGPLGAEYCTAGCIYSYSPLNRVNMFLPAPPF